MLATSGDAAGLGREPRGQWHYERKLDGLRCLAVRSGGEVSLWSRNHLPFTHRFPEVVAGLRALAADAFVIDGELVAYDDAGRTSFSALQRPGRPPAVLAAFDLPALLGRDTTTLDLPGRRSLLAMTLGAGTEGRGVELVEALSGDPVELLAAACARGWEGLVAKRVATPYRSGRSRDWRKLKCHAGQELAIGGWTEPSGARTGFGALLVGYYDSEGRLCFAGRVGTGFDEATLRSLHARLSASETPLSPFADAGRIPGAHWCRPELVAEVRFSEWTPDGRLRHPSFRGLRPDKAAAEVRREPSP